MRLFQELHEEQNLLKSLSKCELSIDHNIYNEITCEESHVFQPFSNQDAGAATIVTQRLILLTENSKTVEEQLEISRRTGLLFDHVPSSKPTYDEIKTARDLIKKMCSQSTDDVQIEFSDLFTKFIQTLRLLSYPSLAALYGHAAMTCPTGRWVFALITNSYLSTVITKKTTIFLNLQLDCKIKMLSVECRKLL